jgi:hypothetical protein
MTAIQIKLYCKSYNTPPNASAHTSEFKLFPFKKVFHFCILLFCGPEPSQEGLSSM